MLLQGYVKQALLKTHHGFNKTTHSLSLFNQPVYGRKIQMATKGARFAAMDISNFYIHNDLEDYQNIRFVMNMIPQHIIYENNLEAIVNNDGYCYVKVRKAFYGLHEAGYITTVDLKRILELEGYVPSKYTPGLFTHKTREIAFSLVVDDFGVQYTKREDAEHLLKTIQDRCPVNIDWDPTSVETKEE